MESVYHLPYTSFLLACPLTLWEGIYLEKTCIAGGSKFNSSNDVSHRRETLGFHILHFATPELKGETTKLEHLAVQYRSRFGYPC